MNAFQPNRTLARKQLMPKSHNSAFRALTTEFGAARHHLIIVRFTDAERTARRSTEIPLTDVMNIETSSRMSKIDADFHAFTSSLNIGGKSLTRSIAARYDLK